MSLYTLFEILAYLVGATLLGFGIGRVSKASRTITVDAETDDTAALSALQAERDAAAAELAEKKVELGALLDEVAALKRASSTMTQRFLPPSPGDPGDVGDDPAGTLDSWPPPDEAELGDADEASRASSSQLQVMVSHLRAKLFDAMREQRRAIEEREAIAVELKAVRKARDAQLDEDAHLQVEIAEREAEVQALRERLAEASREIDDDAEQVTRLDERLASALAQVEDLEAEVRRIGDERDGAVEWSETLAAEMTELRAKMDAWEHRRAELEAAFDAFRAPLTAQISPAPSPPPLGPDGDESEATV